VSSLGTLFISGIYVQIPCIKEMMMMMMMMMIIIPTPQKGAFLRSFEIEFKYEDHFSYHITSAGPDCCNLLEPCACAANPTALPASVHVQSGL
jgi:hypothetical protein